MSLKVTIMSDIHNEFIMNDDEYFSPGSGEVLVLAGDIGNASDLIESGSYYERFLLDASQNYDRVFMVAGNHESYYGDINTTRSLLLSKLPENVRLLDDSSEYYNGCHFIGATLWSDFKNGNSLEMQTAKECMNDYHIIRNGSADLDPSDTLHEHDETIAWLNQVLPTLRGKRFIITHHAPSLQSISGRYGEGITGAYASNLTKMIEYHAPDYWVHGHLHVSNDYKIGDTRIISNPRGYTPHGLNPDFKEVIIDV